MLFTSKTTSPMLLSTAVAAVAVQAVEAVIVIVFAVAVMKK